VSFHRTFESTSSAITDLVKAQSALLDYTGHVRPMPKRRQHELISTIHGLRRQLGWRALDMTGRTK